MYMIFQVRKTIRKKLSTFVQQHSLSSDAKSSSLQRSSVFTFLVSEPLTLLFHILHIQYHDMNMLTIYRI